jgi:hypothetical protein
MRYLSSIFSSESAERRQILRWFFHLVALSAIVFALDRTVFLLFEPPQHPLVRVNEQRIAQFRQALDNGQEYDVIAIGSSMTNHGFDADLFEKSTGYSTLNAGIAGNGTVDRALRELNLILAKKHPKIVIYGIESFSLGIPPGPGDLDTPPKTQFADWFKAHRNSKYVGEWMRGIAKGSIAQLPLFAPSNFSHRFEKFDTAVLHDRGWLEVRAVGNPGMEPVNPDVPFREDQVGALQAFANTTRTHGAKLILVQMPEYLTVLEAFADRYSRFDHFITKFAADNAAEYIKFSGDAQFPFWDISFFHDINRLNSRGAPLYTKLLAQRFLNTQSRASASLSEERR